MRRMPKETMMQAFAIRALICGFVLAAGLTVAAETASAQQPFTQYYVADPHMGVHAEMYVSPVPTPPLVGHTGITYPPLAPHEWLYPHTRRYYQTYNGGRGWNRTTVKWYGGHNWLSPANPLF